MHGYTNISVHAYVTEFTDSYVHVSDYVYAYEHVRMCTIYVYMCWYIYLHIYTYLSISTNACRDIGVHVAHP